MNKIYRNLAVFLFFTLILFSTKVSAHAVQLGYCTSCNGDLRIWIEHWHGTENPATTSLTVTITINGNPTTITGAPDTSVINVPAGQLPGCFTPITIFASCPTSANLYDDWVAYDFPGVQCNVPIEVVVTANAQTTVFTQDCNNPAMYPASTGIFNIPCALNQLPNIDTCAGNTIGPFTFPNGNTWTNSNPAIGLPASGNGNIPAFTAANNATSQTSNIVVTNSCGVATFSITVNSAPISNFTANVGCPGTPVTFVDQSISSGPISSWLWDFGDGSPVFNGQNPPPHLYPPPGPYNVTLTTTTANGCTHDTIIQIDPLGGLVANFVAPSVCEGSPTIFTDTSTPIANIIGWDWDFDGDGITDDITQNPIYIFPNAGTFIVRLIAAGSGGCFDTISIPVVVNPVPIANFSGTNVCFPGTNVFTDSSFAPLGTTYQWDFGDGIGISALQNPSYSYTATGAYLVTLTLTTDSGCVSVYSTTVTAYNLPTAAFTTTDVCANVMASFTDNSNANGGSITSWAWDFGDGIGTSINQNPTYSYNGPGVYNVQLIVSSNGGCSDTIVQTITIFDMPTANYTFTNTCFGTALAFNDLSVIANGNITNWTWDFGNGNTSIVQNPAENYAGEGVYTVQLIVTSNNGCQDTISQQVEVWPTPIVNFNPTEVCLNTPTQFNDLTTVSNLNTTNNIVSWAWNFGDGGTSNIQNPIYTYTISGTYQAQLVVFSNNGCTDSITLTVTVNPLPVIGFSADSIAGCSPLTVNFFDGTVINAPGLLSSWYWNFGNGMTSTAQNPIGIIFENSSPSALTTYGVSLTVTSNKGCVTKDTAVNMITSYPIPKANFSFTPERTNVYDREITFIDQSIIASVWNWDFGDGGTSVAQNPIHEYPDSGSFWVTLFIENIYGCTDMIQKTVIIDPAFAIWIPNVFTPDGDGINDYFFATGFGIVELHTLIFDRWGVGVFEGYNLESKWNGTYKGKVSVEDVYVYKIRAKDVFNEWHEFIGRVTILK